MPGLASDTVWRRRYEQIDSDVDEIRFPRVDTRIDQDAEWCEVVIDGDARKVRFHDYSDVFSVPGLYEELFYEKLECCSPSYLARLLEDVVRENGDHPDGFRVLDVGAGNGMVGEELQEVGVDAVVGVDIIPEAREATLRDRPEVYDDYRVTDLTDIPEVEEERLRRKKLNCLTTVAALGFGDIPPLAFAKALDLIAAPGWLAFNIKEDFLRDEDSSGFSRLIRKLCREEYIQIFCSRRYQHRISMTGQPLFYVAIVAQKLRDLDEQLWDALSDGDLD